MKPIDEMSDQEKSMTLVMLCGWRYGQVGDDSCNGKSFTTISSKSGVIIWYKDASRYSHANLYDPANMALAWRVLNWAMTHFPDGPTETEPAMLFFEWWHDSQIYNSCPADAQRLWLDKILSLAIEAGMCEDTPVSQEGSK